MTTTFVAAGIARAVTYIFLDSGDRNPVIEWKEGRSTLLEAARDVKRRNSAKYLAGKLIAKISVDGFVVSNAGSYVAGKVVELFSSLQSVARELYTYYTTDKASFMETCQKIYDFLKPHFGDMTTIGTGFLTGYLAPFIKYIAKSLELEGRLYVLQVYALFLHFFDNEEEIQIPRIEGRAGQAQDNKRKRSLDEDIKDLEAQLKKKKQEKAKLDGGKKKKAKK